MLLKQYVHELVKDDPNELRRNSLLLVGVVAVYVQAGILEIGLVPTGKDNNRCGA